MTHHLIARDLIMTQGRSALKTVANRKKFAADLYSALEFWSFEEMSTFVEEMRGLNFCSVADRELFLQFLSSWLRLEDVQ